jgi:tetratricopeptide (TPR) repeat protein
MLGFALVRCLPIASALVMSAIFTAPCHDARAEGSAWARDTAVELVRQGLEHARNGDDELAARRFMDAIQLEPTLGPAYLELASVRERSGDLREAERTYDVAIRSVPGFVAAFRRRAAVLHRLGDAVHELADLEEAARLTDEPDVLLDLARRHVEDRAWPAALATWRKVLAKTEAKGDRRLVEDARIQIRALGILCSELDPVSEGASSRDWVRRAEASVAKRRGM